MDAGFDRLAAALNQSVLRVLHALVRVLLRHGMPLPAFMELAKRAYVDVALREFAIPGRKPSVSRASLLTGLTRKEVQRLLDSAQLSGGEPANPHNRAARVVAGWVRDPEFHDALGRPRDLPAEGSASFADLVRRYSGDVPPRAVLDELLRVGTIERAPDGGVRLLERAYIPRASDVGKLAILGTDVAYLVETIDHNLQSGTAAPRFQRKVMYDNLPAEAIAEFRALAAQNAQQLIEQLDGWLARHDRDANPAVQGDGRFRAGLGIFCFEEEIVQPKGARKS